MTMKYRQYSISDILVNADSLEDKFLCEICSECIFSDFNKISSLQCKEGHIFCTSCWTKSLERKNECMACRTPCDLKSLSKNIVLQNEFRNKKVYCPNKFKFSHGKTFEKDEKYGCKMEVKIDELETHIKNCQFEFIECPFNSFRPTAPTPIATPTTPTKNKCTYKVRKNGVEAHREFCSFMAGVCKFCNYDLYNKEGLKQHQDQSCEKILVKCPQECTSIVSNTTKSSSSYQPTFIERGKMKNHILNDCLNTIIHCKYREGGCTDTFQKCNEFKHLTDVNHLVFIQNIRDIQSKESQEIFKLLTSENIALKSELEEANKTINTMLRTRIRPLEEYRAISNNQIIDLNNQYLQLYTKTTNEKKELLDQITTLNKHVSGFSSKIAHIKKDYLNHIDALMYQISSFEWESQYVKPCETDHKYKNRWALSIKASGIIYGVSPIISFGNNNFIVSFKKYDEFYEISLSLKTKWLTSQKCVLFNITLNHPNLKESLTFKTDTKPVIFIPEKKETYTKQKFVSEQDIRSFIYENHLWFDIFIQVIPLEPSILKS